MAKPGTYIFEPVGEAHILVVAVDSPEPMTALFAVNGGLIYREAGLDPRNLDHLVL